MLNELKDIVAKHNIVERTMKLCEEKINTLKDSQQEELNKIYDLYCSNKIYVGIQTISYMLCDYNETNNEHIVVNVLLIYENEGIANYEVIYSIDGKLISQKMKL